MRLLRNRSYVGAIRSSERFNSTDNLHIPIVHGKGWKIERNEDNSKCVDHVGLTLCTGSV